jgi:excisionase family DNA binding protein
MDRVSNGASPTASMLAFSVQGAARALSISVRTVYRHLAAGELAGCKDGNRTLIAADELVRFLRSRPAYRPPGAA